MAKKKISTLKKKLWRVTSKYIRARDKNICFTCDRFAEGSGYHAGHFIPQSTCGLYLKYDERNIAGQCYHCNINCGGNGAEYYRRMVEKHGQEYVDEIFRDKQRTTKWTEQDYLDKIEYYKELLETVDT